MGALIDTSVLIAADCGHLDLDPHLTELQTESIAIAAITASELVHGLHQLAGVQRAKSETRVERWLALLPIIPFDLRVARAHAALAADLEVRGMRPAAHDLIIAATAVWLGYDVVTRDRRGFARIEGLNVQHW